MNRSRACACALAALLLTGCAAAGTQAAARTQAPARTQAAGHLTGKLVMEGGPLGPGGRQPGQRPIPGTVTFTAPGHRQVTVQVGRSGAFSLRLPPGKYQVSGRSPSIVGTGSTELPCSQPLMVTVTARHPATVTVACIVP
jgi:hypothetical protein